MKELKPFWNEQTAVESNRIWLPQNDVPCTTEKRNKLFDIQKITNSDYIQVPSENEVRVETRIRCRKIKIYPSQKQKEVFCQWMGTSRYVYNRALASVEEKIDKPNWMNLRNKYVTQKNNTICNPWEFDTPKDIRAGAIRDLCKAYKLGFQSLKKKSISQFKMKFRSKRDTQSIVISKEAIKYSKKSFQIYPTILGKRKIRTSNDKALKKLKKKIEHDTRLMTTPTGDWYLCIPMDLPVPNNDIRSGSVCGVDPGCRKFNVIYSNEAVYKIPVNQKYLKKLRTRIDLLQSLRSRKAINTNKFKRSNDRVYKRFNNLVDDIHHSTIKILSKYEKIYLPKFESQELVQVIHNKKTKRDLMCLKHYQFRIRVSDRCGKQLNLCTEEYTSMTCTKCGTLNDVGSNEVYKCNSCGIVIDRDVNGARNILLKHTV